MTRVSASIAAFCHNAQAFPLSAMRSLSYSTPTRRSQSMLSLGWRLGPGLRGLGFLITLNTDTLQRISCLVAYFLYSYKHLCPSAEGSWGSVGS